MTISKLARTNDHVIVFVDMDCFEIQLYLKKKEYKHFRGTPCIVADDSGRILCASYEARKYNISRHIRVDQAVEMCPHINIITKANIWGKPDAETTRHGSWDVLDALTEFCTQYGVGTVLEYAPSDGFFIDLTKIVHIRMLCDFVEVGSNVHIEGFELLKNANRTRFYKHHTDRSILKLLHAAAFVFEMAVYLFEKTEIQCSAGISNNKLVAKMACQLHKPNGITVLPVEGFHLVRNKIDVSEIPGFGRSSTNGAIVKEILSVQNLEQLFQLIENKYDAFQLALDDQNLGHLASKLKDGARGICTEDVVPKKMNNTVSSGKSFHGFEREMTQDALLGYLDTRACEMVKRLREERNRHNRITNSLQIQYEFPWGGKRTHKFEVDTLVADQDLEDEIYYASLYTILPEGNLTPDETIFISKIALQASDWEYGPSLNQITTPDENGNYLTNLQRAVTMAERKNVYHLKIHFWSTNQNVHVQFPENYSVFRFHESILEAIKFKSLKYSEFYVARGYNEENESAIKFMAAPKTSFAGLDRAFPYQNIHTPMMSDFFNTNTIGATVFYRLKDKWNITVELEKIAPADPSMSYPYFVPGEKVDLESMEDAGSLKRSNDILESRTEVQEEVERPQNQSCQQLSVTNGINPQEVIQTNQTYTKRKGLHGCCTIM